MILRGLIAYTRSFNDISIFFLLVFLKVKAGNTEVCRKVTPFRVPRLSHTQPLTLRREISPSASWNIPCFAGYVSARPWWGKSYPSLATPGGRMSSALWTTASFCHKMPPKSVFCLLTIGLPQIYCYNIDVYRKILATKTCFGCICTRKLVWN